jgi:hypothetical protein
LGESLQWHLFFFWRESAEETPTPIFIYVKKYLQCTRPQPKLKKGTLQKTTQPQLEFINKSWFSPKQNQIHFPMKGSLQVEKDREAPSKIMSFL